MNNNYKESFEQTKTAGSLAAETLDEITSYVKPGVATDKLDKICYEFIRDNDGYSAPLFYRGFPKSCCTSVNHVICHGIPTNKYLKEGDIINIDVTAVVNGYHGDTSRMFFIGDTSVKSKNLVNATYESMMKGISIIKPGLSIILIFDLKVGSGWYPSNQTYSNLFFLTSAMNYSSLLLSSSLDFTILSANPYLTASSEVMNLSLSISAFKVSSGCPVCFS